MALFVWQSRLLTAIFAVAALILQIAMILPVDKIFSRVTAIYM